MLKNGMALAALSVMDTRTPFEIENDAYQLFKKACERLADDNSRAAVVSVISASDYYRRTVDSLTVH